MESHGYPAINSEKTMFMKWEGDDFILHGLFVDDMSTIPTSDHLKEDFMTLYSADFDVTGGDLMQSFLGLEVEQLEGCIKLHLDTYIQELIAEYQLICPKFLKPKKVLCHQDLCWIRMIAQRHQTPAYRNSIAQW